MNQGKTISDNRDLSQHQEQELLALQETFRWDFLARRSADWMQQNTVREADSFPMGNVIERVYHGAKAKYIFLMDATRVYWEIFLEEFAKMLTAFATLPFFFSQVSSTTTKARGTREGPKRHQHQ